MYLYGDEVKDTVVGYSASDNRRSEWHSDCLAKHVDSMNIGIFCISLFSCQETVSLPPGMLEMSLKQ